jgi:hypothetical protein
MRPSFRNYRPRSLSAAARLIEAQRILCNLRDRGFPDEVIGRWLGADPAAIARWRSGSAVPSPDTLAALRRFVRTARHES